MTIRLLGSTSGYSEIDAPAVAGDQTFTLPSAGGNLITDGSDLTAQVKTATNASGSAPIYSCRAWVNFNGTGSVAIRASGNVSSITDNGTGYYTVNFTTAMVDANYAVVYSSKVDATGTGALMAVDTHTTTGTRLLMRNTSGTEVDCDFVDVAIFR
jgi:hypothetical protein